MKLILEESQVNNMSEEKKADALYFLMNAYFPDNFEEDEWRGDSNVIAGRNDEKIHTTHHIFTGSYFTICCM